MIESTRQHERSTAVVLVHPLGRGLAAAVPNTSIEVSSVLDAIGFVARGTERQRVSAVIVGRAELERFPDAATAIKRLDDGVRVIEITSGPGLRPPVADVDVTIEDGSDVERVAAAVGGRMPFASGPPSAEPESGMAAADGSSVETAPPPRFDAPIDPPLEPNLEPTLDPTLERADSDDPADDVMIWPFEPAAGRPPSSAAIEDPRSAADLVGESERRALGGDDLLPSLDAQTPVSDAEHDIAAAANDHSDFGVWDTRPDAGGSRLHDRRDDARRVDDREDHHEHGAESPGLDDPPFDAERDAPPREMPPTLSFAEAVRARESGFESTIIRETPLGDVDLVEAVLAGDGRIGPIAVQLIREQTGWADLRFDLEEGPADARDGEAAYADVVDDGRRFGGLTSATAASDELTLWAGWLARWLELGRRHELYRTQSRVDDLTGAGNRRAMFEFLDGALEDARRRRRPLTVMVFDIDDFKTFNDRFGHEAGDTILRETIALLQAVTRRNDRVCRIGGDEFAVVFADSESDRSSGAAMIDDVEVIARRFQSEVVEMRFPRLGLDAPGTLSISAGLATFPWDGSDATSLLRAADHRALESKRRGKNHITFGPGVPFHGTVDQDDDTPTE